MSRTDEPPVSDPRSLEDTIGDAPPSNSDAVVGSPGATLSRYIVIERLGAGAMGVVLRGYDPRLRREVALKLLHQREDAEAEARMLREAQSMAQLSHPNVVGIYDAESTEQGVMIAMELVTGLPLDRWLDAAERTPAEVLAVFVQAGRGLAAAHAAGLIHRDFKPANVFVGTDGDGGNDSRVRVGDFGLAREKGAADETEASEPSHAPATELTATGTIMGTPVYMAPEQHMGQIVDARADQFAFCVSLWEAIHGEPPFGGTTVFALAYAKQNGELRPARAKIPAAIQAAIVRGLAKDPAERWPDLAALLQQLQPRRRAWSTLAIAGTVVLAAATTSAIVLWDSAGPREARCTSAQQQLAAAWNPQLEQTLHQRRRAPDRLLSALARYAQELGNKYSSVCDATPPLEDLEFDVTLSCLDSRTRWVAAIVERISTTATPDDKRVDKMIDSLTPIDRCARTQLKGARLNLPDDPDRKALVLELQRENAEVQRLENEGRISEAIVAADAALARAETSEFPPALANALFIRSSLAKAEKRFDYAAALLRRVVELRLAIGDNAGGIAAATQLVFVRGVLQDKYAEADGWAAVVRGLIGATDIGPVRRGWFFNHIGASKNARGQPQAALVPLQRAVDELTDGLGPDHKSVADPLSHLASALLKLGRASEALGPAERALALRLPHYPPGALAVETARLNLARAQREAGSIAEALETLEAALDAVPPGEDASRRKTAVQAEIAGVRGELGAPEDR